MLGVPMTETEQKASTKATGEFKAGMESAATGLGTMVRGGVNKFLHDNPLARATGTGQEGGPLPWGKTWEDMSPDEVKKHFLDAVAIRKQEEAIGTGEGYWQQKTGFSASELAKDGIQLDQEKIQSLAMTDPISFVASARSLGQRATGECRPRYAASRTKGGSGDSIGHTEGRELLIDSRQVGGLVLHRCCPIAKTLGPVAVCGGAAIQGEVLTFGEVLAA
jgi:hypothetical protein